MSHLFINKKEHIILNVLCQWAGEAKNLNDYKGRDSSFRYAPFRMTILN